MRIEILFSLALAGLFPHSDAKPKNNAFQNAILFPNPTGGSGAYSASWISTPTASQVRHALNSEARVQGRTEWECGVRKNGRLSKCILQTSWPSDPAYEAAGRRLLKWFRLSGKTAADAQINNAKVIFSINFFGDGLKAPDVGGCPPPFCTSIPPPPPPPAPTTPLSQHS